MASELAARAIGDADGVDFAAFENMGSVGRRRGGDEDGLAVGHPRGLAMNFQIAERDGARRASSGGNEEEVGARREGERLAIGRPGKGLRRVGEVGEFTGAKHPDLGRAGAVGDPGEFVVGRPARGRVAPRAVGDALERAAGGGDLPQVGARGIGGAIVPGFDVDDFGTVGVDARADDFAPRPPIVEAPGFLRCAKGNRREEKQERRAGGNACPTKATWLTIVRVAHGN